MPEATTSKEPQPKRSLTEYLDSELQVAGSVYTRDQFVEFVEWMHANELASRSDLLFPLQAIRREVTKYIVGDDQNEESNRAKELVKRIDIILRRIEEVRAEPNTQKETVDKNGEELVAKRERINTLVQIIEADGDVLGVRKYTNPSDYAKTIKAIKAECAELDASIRDFQTAISGFPREIREYGNETYVHSAREMKDKLLELVQKYERFEYTKYYRYVLRKLIGDCSTLRKDAEKSVRDKNLDPLANSVLSDKYVELAREIEKQDDAIRNGEYGDLSNDPSARHELNEVFGKLREDLGVAEKAIDGQKGEIQIGILQRKLNQLIDGELTQLRIAEGVDQIINLEMAAGSLRQLDAISATISRKIGAAVLDDEGRKYVPVYLSEINRRIDAARERLVEKWKELAFGPRGRYYNVIQDLESLDTAVTALDQSLFQPQTRQRIDRHIRTLTTILADNAIVVTNAERSYVTSLIDRYRAIDLAVSKGIAGVEDERSKPRNDFENFLVSKAGFPKERLHEWTPEAAELKMAYFLTEIYSWATRNLSWPSVVIADPGTEFKFNAASGPMSAKDVALSCMDNSNFTAAERKTAEKFKGDIEDFIAVIGQIFTVYKEIKRSAGDSRAQQSLSALKNVYGGDAIKGMLNPIMIKVWESFPKLLYTDEHGDKHLEQHSLGEMFFHSFREILASGRVWADKSVPDGSPWIRAQVTGWQPRIYDKKGKNTALYAYDDHGTHPIVLHTERFPKSLGTVSLFPEPEAGGQSNIKPFTLYRLRALASQGDPRVFDTYGGFNRAPYTALLSQSSKYEEPSALLPRKRTITGEMATILAYQLAVITGEGDWQDNVGGRPVGQNVLARIEHASDYAQKTNSEESKESKTNPFAVGRALSIVRPATKFLTCNGMTLEQAIMLGNGWKDIDTSNWPPQMMQKWLDQMVQGFGEYERIEGGGPDLFKLAEIDLKEGRIKVNDAVIKKVHDTIRYAVEYHSARDMAPGAVALDWEQNEAAFDTPPQDEANRRFPSEEFMGICILDSNGNIIPRKDGKRLSLVTRFPQYYVTNNARLGMWIRGKNENQQAYDYSGVHNEYVIDDDGNRTGQVNQYIVLRLKDGVDPEINAPEVLIKRLLVSYVFEMAAMPGDTVARLEKDDLLTLGIFLSSEIRRKYLAGHYGVPSDLIKTKIGHVLNKVIPNLNMEFFEREDPGIVGDDLYSEAQYFMLLAEMGHRITAEDFQKAGSTISDLFKAQGSASK